MMLAASVGLAGCVTTGTDRVTSGGAVRPAITATPIEDPMLAAPPPGEAAGNGSQRVPLGELATNAAGPNPPPAPQTASSAAASAPLLLLPPSGTSAPSPAPPQAAPTPAPPAAAPVAPTPPAPPQKSASAKAAPAPSPPMAPTVMPPPAAATAAAPAPMAPEPVAKAEPAAEAPKLKLTIPPPGSKPATPNAPEPADTVVISSQSAAPVHETREFIPAMVASSAAPVSEPPGSMVSRPLSAAEKNVAQRFDVLHELLDENLITPEEYARHRGANIGALLPYTHEPGAVGLERPAPGADAVVARLEALRRSLEMRAISTKQHAMERSMILNALLPEAPADRADQMPPPEDVIQAATIISHLQTLRGRNLISAEEFDGERKAIEQYIKTGTFISPAMAKADAAARAAAAKQAEAAKTAKADQAEKAEKSKSTEGEDELTAPVPGPVLHLASFRTKEAANRGWQEATARNKALLAPVHEVVRRVDLGPERGVFYRLMAGPYPSLAAAEAACIQLKQNNQFCRASADGS